MPVERMNEFERLEGSVRVRDDKPGGGVVDEFSHRPAVVGNDRGTAGHGFDDAIAEGFIEVDEVKEGVGAPEHPCTVGGIDGAEEADRFAVDVGSDLVGEVLLILDDASDGQGRFA